MITVTEEKNVLLKRDRLASPNSAICSKFLRKKSAFTSNKTYKTWGDYSFRFSQHQACMLVQFYGMLGEGEVLIKRQTQVFAVILKRLLPSGCSRAISFVMCLNCFEKEISCTLVSQHAFRNNCVPFAGTVESVAGFLNVSMLLMDICVLVLVLVVGVA